MDAAKIELYTHGGTCSITQAADLLGVSRWCVHAMVHRGELVAWTPTPRCRKLRLYKRQVMEIASEQQARALKRASLLQAEFALDC